MAKYKAKKKAKAQKPKEGAYYLLCKIRLGSFERERGVIIEISDAENITAIVDKSDVLPDSKPSLGAIVGGKLKIFVVDEKGDKLIVDLPRETFSSGPRIAVPRELVVAA